MQFKLPFLASWPLGSVLLPLKRKPFFFSRSLPVSCSSPSLPTACRESKRERHTQNCSYSINRSHCTFSLVTFRLLADAQPLPPVSYRKFYCITLSAARKNIYWNLYSASAKRTPFYTDPVMHTNQSRLWKSNWKRLPYYCLCMWNTDFLSMTKHLLCDILTSKT